MKLKFWKSASRRDEEAPRTQSHFSRGHTLSDANSPSIAFTNEVMLQDDSPGSYRDRIINEKLEK